MKILDVERGERVLSLEVRREQLAPGVIPHEDDGLVVAYQLFDEVVFFNGRTLKIAPRIQKCGYPSCGESW